MAKTTKTAAPDGDYNDLLNVAWDDLPEDINLASGDWELKGKNAKYMAAREEGQNGYVLFFYKATQPLTVADGDIEAMGEYDFKQNDLSFQIWIDKNSAWKGKVGPHLQKHGINPEGHTIPDLLKAFSGSSVIATIGERSFTTKAGELATQNTLSNFRALS